MNTKICLSISGHHPETWQPSWSIRTALLAIIGFMPSPGHGTIGSLNFSAEERRVLARRSRSFKCRECGETAALLADPEDVTEEGAKTEAQSTKEEASEVIKNMSFKVNKISNVFLTM